ncbi:hypothetical protein OAN307_c38710 [Octadecabacter antarcticus 307]|uniref:Uncharacterized protein n=1 Tax=Octadecabacter antarcticus 307 TaxID=391626 RepID=M9R9G8_9RHOB|nr:hypothetical protein OAN307_c38710 [Octadecabacter antarcticus 307]
MSGYHRRSRVETSPLGHCCAIHYLAADALYETTWSELGSARLRPAGCGNPNPRSDTQWLHRTWHPQNRCRSVAPSGVRGSQTSCCFVQQSRWSSKFTTRHFYASVGRDPAQCRSESPITNSSSLLEKRKRSPSQL